MIVRDLAAVGLWMPCNAEHLRTRGAMLSRLPDNMTEQSGKIAKACLAPRLASRSGFGAPPACPLVRDCQDESGHAFARFSSFSRLSPVVAKAWHPTQPALGDVAVDVGSPRQTHETNDHWNGTTSPPLRVKSACSTALSTPFAMK